MLIISEEIREELRKPQGKLISMNNFVKKYGKTKIIAVGDIVVLALIANGIKPFLAIYDFKTRREALEKNEQDKLNAVYPIFSKVKNPPGTITYELEKKLPELLKIGGALFIDGEEDLATLVLMRICPDGFIIIYGQPNQGVVVIECNEKTRKKAEKFFKNISFLRPLQKNAVEDNK